KLFESEEVIPIPIAHAEGRFVTKDSSLLNQLKKNKQISFQYCDEQGNIIERFPINPNETTLNIAGISNKEGNVLAIMPHPERASFKRQIPNIRLQDFEDAESNAPAVKIFDSMKKYILANFSHRKILPF
ncbi:MAG: phosphoribosylformylglycinamidine synthase subunit PurQ, partial [Nanoarchaeota archaeon]